MSDRRRYRCARWPLALIVCMKEGATSTNKSNAAVDVQVKSERQGDAGDWKL